MMQRTFRGYGTLLVLGQRFDNVPYEFTAVVANNRINAAGHLTVSASPQIALDVVKCGNVVLQLEGGATVDISATNAAVPNSNAVEVEFVVSGPIPGFP